MMKKVVLLLNNYKGVINYLFFGVCTTVINVIAYTLFYNCLGMSNVPATVVAWGLAVVFAFITNKLFVFESKSFEPSVLFKEISSFFLCRVLTGLLDVLIMYIAVDVFASSPLLWKILSNILVILLNYVASKLVIFKNK